MSQQTGQAYDKLIQVLDKAKNWVKSRYLAIGKSGKVIMAVCLAMSLFGFGVWLGLRQISGFGELPNGSGALVDNNLPPEEFEEESEEQFDADISHDPDSNSDSNSDYEENSGADAKPVSLEQEPSENGLVPPNAFEPEINPEAEEQEVQAAFSRIIKPVSGEVIKRPGWYYSEELEQWQFYPGVDISTATGTEIKAVVAGVIKRIYSDEAGKGVLVIGHGNRYETYYGGVSWSELALGQKVTAGEVIATATDGVVHFRLIDDDEAVDPTPLFQDQNY